MPNKRTKNMRAYMACSRHEGPEEGAILVIHNTAREAKVLAWQSGECLNIDEYLDICVIWINNDETILLLANQDKLAANEPHVVGSPPECESCDLWGCGMNPDNTCGSCGGYPGEEIIRLLT